MSSVYSLVLDVNKDLSKREEDTKLQVKRKDIKYKNIVKA